VSFNRLPLWGVIGIVRETLVAAGTKQAESLQTRLNGFLDAGKAGQ
jgi:hypothetical protein